MAKAPIPGSTKTRLAPLLGPHRCARLQAELIRHAATLDDGHGVLAYTPPDRADLIRPLVGPHIVLCPQRGADLGQRMSAAVTEATKRHPGPIIVIGTDCPVLRPTHLAAATAQLHRGHDVVLGPAYDGGYYLIALARPDPRVFALPAPAWGGPDVAARTIEAAAAAGLRVGLIDPEHDLDTPAQAIRLIYDPRLPPAIAAVLTGG